MHGSRDESLSLGGNSFPGVFQWLQNSAVKLHDPSLCMQRVQNIFAISQTLDKFAHSTRYMSLVWMTGEKAHKNQGHKQCQGVKENIAM